MRPRREDDNACAEGDPGDGSERVPRAASGGVCDGVPNGQQAPGCDGEGDCSRDICRDGECGQAFKSGSCEGGGQCKNGSCETGEGCSQRCDNEGQECLIDCQGDEFCACLCEQKFNWCQGSCGEPGDHPAECSFAAPPPVSAAARP